MKKKSAELNSVKNNFLNPEPEESESDNLAGMGATEAKEYILGFITTLKLTEKEIHSLEEVAARWNRRVTLARYQGKDTLYTEAIWEEEKVNTKLAALRKEENALRERIAAMRQQLPGLAARERSIDPDLLEQELLMALGSSEEEAGTEKAFRELEKQNAVTAALEALKAKMKRN